MRPPQCQGAKPYEAPWTPVEEIRNNIVIYNRKYIIEEYISFELIYYLRI